MGQFCLELQGCFGLYCLGWEEIPQWDGPEEEYQNVMYVVLNHRYISVGDWLTYWQGLGNLLYLWL